MGAMTLPVYDAQEENMNLFKQEAGMYDWQQWNAQVLTSRCREEKYDPLMAGVGRTTFPVLGGGGQEGFRRTPGAGYLGTC